MQKLSPPVTEQIYEQLIKGEQEAHSDKGHDSGLRLLLQQDLLGLGFEHKRSQRLGHSFAVAGQNNKQEQCIDHGAGQRAIRVNDFSW